MNFGQKLREHRSRLGLEAPLIFYPIGLKREEGEQ